MKKTVLGLTGKLKWRESGKVKGLPPGPREYDATSVRQISPLVFNFGKLTERVLIAVCMSVGSLLLEEGPQKY